MTKTTNNQPTMNILTLLPAMLIGGGIGLGFALGTHFAHEDINDRGDNIALSHAVIEQAYNDNTQSYAAKPSETQIQSIAEATSKCALGESPASTQEWDIVQPNNSALTSYNDPSHASVMNYYNMQSCLSQEFTNIAHEDESFTASTHWLAYNVAYDFVSQTIDMNSEITDEQRQAAQTALEPRRDYYLRNKRPMF